MAVYLGFVWQLCEEKPLMPFQTIIVIWKLTELDFDVKWE